MTDEERIRCIEQTFSFARDEEHVSSEARDFIFLVDHITQLKEKLGSLKYHINLHKMLIAYYNLENDQQKDVLLMIEFLEYKKSLK